VATATSKDPGSGTKGGDLGCNPKGVFVAEFDKAAFSLPLNTVSDPVQTQFGFHVLLVKERKPTPFEQARQQLQITLDTQGQNAFRKFLDGTARKAKVTVDRRYGTFQKPQGQAPSVIPPEVPSPAEGRPEPGEGGQQTPEGSTPAPSG
jgi:foldase protein PrsA